MIRNNPTMFLPIVVCESFKFARGDVCVGVRLRAGITVAKGAAAGVGIDARNGCAPSVNSNDLLIFESLVSILSFSGFSN